MQMMIHRITVGLAAMLLQLTLDFLLPFLVSASWLARLIGTGRSFGPDRNINQISQLQ